MEIKMRKGRHAKGVGRHADTSRKVKMFGKPKGGGRHAKRLKVVLDFPDNHGQRSGSGIFYWWVVIKLLSFLA